MTNNPEACINNITDTCLTDSTPEARIPFNPVVDRQIGSCHVSMKQSRVFSTEIDPQSGKPMLKTSVSLILNGLVMPEQQLKVKLCSAVDGRVLSGRCFKVKDDGRYVRIFYYVPSEELIDGRMELRVTVSVVRKTLVQVEKQIPQTHSLLGIIKWTKQETVTRRETHTDTLAEDEFAVTGLVFKPYTVDGTFAA